jgi:hypothetical protein
MTIGVIFTAYNMADMIEKSFSPWLEAKTSNTGGHKYIICGISVPFEKFNDPACDDTVEILQDYHKSNNLDNLITDNQPKRETEARTLALKWLISNKADIIIQVDADEFYTINEIKNIFSFVEKNPFIDSFRGSLKNYVFDESVFMLKPFNPMRIHRVTTHNRAIALEFWDDNNICYKLPEGQTVLDTQLSVSTIPKFIAWTKHLSWLSNDRSRKKVEYQNARGWKCSFKWNYVLNKLEWNLDNLELNGEQVPDLGQEKLD